MRYSDLHVHSTFSDGLHSVEELVQAAIRKNMLSIGISDHSFTEFDLRYCMKKGRVQEYLAEIRRVRACYGDRIEIYTGLEYDGYSELEDTEGFDYLIGDCHYIKTWDGYHSVDHSKEEQGNAIENYFAGDPMAYARAYYETFVARTQLHRPDILGHFDVVTKQGFMDEESAAYRDLATDALIACLETTPILEMNTGSVNRRWRTTAFPNAFLLREALTHGGKVILSSDSHCADTLTGAFDQAVELLKALGWKSMVVLRQGAFCEVGI